jgi:hypothetical protein
VFFRQVAQAYLEHLLKEGRFEEAANLCPRLLKVAIAAPTTPESLQILQGKESLQWFQGKESLQFLQGLALLLKPGRLKHSILAALLSSS